MKPLPEFVPALLLFLGVLIPRAAEAADERRSNKGERGAVRGVVAYDSDRKRFWRYRRYYVADRKTGHLAEAVVCLMMPQKATYPSQPRTWEIDQENFRFVPEVLAIRGGDKVAFANSDPLLHDVTVSATQADGTLKHQKSYSLQQRQKAVRSFSESGGIERPVRISCRFHGGMRAWIYVFDHPFFQVTGKEGRFEFKQVPAGEYELVVVHPAGNLRSVQKLNVTSEGVTNAEVRLSPDHLMKPQQNRPGG